MNGATAHKKLYIGGLINCLTEIKKEQGVRGLYGGFGVNMIRCAPMGLI